MAPVKSQKKKGMSFGTLLGLFAGGFVLVVVIAVLVMKTIAAQKQGSRTVTQRTPQQISSPVEPQQDVVGEHLLTLQAARAAEEAAATQRQAIEIATQETQRMIMPRLNAMDEKLDSLGDRVSVIEASTRGGVQVIKAPPRERTPERNRTRSPSRSAGQGGYAVVAVVGDRRWVTAGDSTYSVTEDETLPAIPPAPVPAAKASNGGGISTSDR